MKVGKLLIRLFWACAIPDESSITNTMSTSRWSGYSVPVHLFAAPASAGCSSSVLQASTGRQDSSAQPRTSGRMGTGRLQERENARMFDLLLWGISRSDSAFEKIFPARAFDQTN